MKTNLDKKKTSLKDKFKKLLHRHKFTTLVIYSPYEDDDTYDFLLRCDCGHTKLTKIPYGIKKIKTVSY